jgi:flagellar hook-associated protein 2
MDIGKISSAGLGSGLDVSSIVTQLMAIERKPVSLLEAGQKKLDTQLSSLGKLQSSLSSLRDAARALTNTSTWGTTTVSSSDASYVSAAGSGSTPTGNYAVEVSALAAPQSLASATVPGPTHVVGTGTLNIEIGQWFTDPPDFTPNSGATQVSIAITAGDDTLEKIRDKINAADAGVVASVVNDATGSRLAIRSSETGETNAFRITVADDDGVNDDASGLSMFAYDANASTASPMTRTLEAANARLTINNIPISSASNTMTDVLDGLSLTVTRKTTSPIDLSVQRDSESIKKAITDFADAYNGVVKIMREQTGYNADTKVAGALQGDRLAVGMLSKLRTLAGGSSSASAAFTRLSDIGLTPQRDGTLSVNTTKLDSAIGRLDDLKDFFSRDDTDDANDGFATMLRQYADLQMGVDGPLTSRQEGLRDRIDGIKDRVASYEDRLALTEKRLLAQYTKLDNNMASLSGLQSYIAQQVTRWNNT